MKRTGFTGALAALAALFVVPATHAQIGGTDVYWHLNPSVKSCSMAIDPSLTQDQWHRFTRQAAAMVSFKALAPATPLGKGTFQFSVDGGRSPVNQRDLAWINTFTHPDADCPLGDAIRLRNLRARIGVTDRIDAGACWTDAPRANYGAVGADIKYTFLQERPRRPAAAVRASAAILTGVPDFDMGIYSVDLIASKKVATLTPYAGVKQSLVVGTEETAKVDLDQERHGITQGYLGLAYSIWMINLAAEYNVSTVNTLAVAIGFYR